MSSAGSRASAPSRRLSFFGSRSTARAVARYFPAAAPERQTPPALWVPTRLGRFVATIAAVFVVGGGFVAAGTPAVVSAISGLGGERFRGTAAAAVACLDLAVVHSLAHWFAMQSLWAAAGLCCVIRGMLRHRQPSTGRSFTWLATVLGGAALASQVPVGKVVATGLSEATGLELGTAGQGWWLAITAAAVGATVVPSLMSLSRRAAPGLWLTAGMVGWALAATAEPAGLPGASTLAAAGWDVGSLTMLVGVLVAARGVIREIRGPSQAVAPSRVKPVEATNRPVVADRQIPDAELTQADAARVTPTLYTDGSDGAGDDGERTLSKAERKRLRKLARIREAEAAAAA